MAIQFNTTVFTEPIPLDRWQPHMGAGLYAILVPDAKCKPKPYAVIYFGQTANFAERGFPNSHHKSENWRKQCGAGQSLYVAVCNMPLSNEWSRNALETSLIKTYLPVCNEKGVATPLFSNLIE